MTTPVLPALIVFGVLFAIAIFGFIRSNAAAKRINATGHPIQDNETRRSSPAVHGTDNY